MTLREKARAAAFLFDLVPQDAYMGATVTRGRS